MICIISEPNSVDVILTRSPANTNFNRKQVSKFKDNDIATLEQVIIMD